MHSTINDPLPGILYVVPTPIGNLGDLSFRAAKLLEKADIIIAEDTRVVQNLLRNYEIKANSLHSYREQVHHKMLPKITDWLSKNMIVVLTTDAGTPSLSDPGVKLIHDLQTNGIKVEVLPGASAITTALVASGLPTDHFMFVGFLPRRKNKLANLFKDSQHIHKLLATTFIAFESPHRLNKTLLSFLEMYKNVVQQQKQVSTIHKQKPPLWNGIMDPQIKKQLLAISKDTSKQKVVRDKPIVSFCIARELTKKFEQVTKVTLNSNFKDSLLLWKSWQAKIEIRGEFTIVWRWLN